MEKVLIIGARRRRQGIGGYVARAFHAAGCKVAAVVGTTIQSATHARGELRSCGIDTNPYDDLLTALESERPEIVAICTPYGTHRAQLELVGQARAHCLCEKPLWWGPAAGRADHTQQLVDPFMQAGRYLDLMTQWPRTLPAYERLFPQCREEAVERFDMRLSPITTGPEMVLDAAPHVLSMLWALLGPGSVAPMRAHFRNGGRELTMNFAYHHHAGRTDVSMQFVTCEQQPRPAWYGVNGRIAVREIEMPSYAMRLRAQDDSGAIPLPDPLPLHVEAFVDDVRRGATTDAQRLVASIVNLWIFYEAAGIAL